MMNGSAASNSSKLSVAAAWLAIAAASAVLLLLVGLHRLSPEFDPSLNVLSEYANGQYGGVLSILFVCWGVSSWALAVTVWSEVSGVTGKIGLFFLIAAGTGEALAAVFDIKHPLHELVGAIGVLSLPIAAMLIGISLARTPSWSCAKVPLLWTANLTWIILVVMFASLLIMIRRYSLAGHRIVVIGWANRLLVVLYGVWVLTVAIQALRLRRAAR